MKRYKAVLAIEKEIISYCSIKIRVLVCCVKGRKKGPYGEEDTEGPGRKEILLGGSPCKGVGGRYWSQEMMSILGWRQRYSFKNKLPLPKIKTFLNYMSNKGKIFRTNQFSVSNKMGPEILSQSSVIRRGQECIPSPKVGNRMHFYMD